MQWAAAESTFTVECTSGLALLARQAASKPAPLVLSRFPRPLSSGHLTILTFLPYITRVLFIESHRNARSDTPALSMPQCPGCNLQFAQRQLTQHKKKCLGIRHSAQTAWDVEQRLRKRARVDNEIAVDDPRGFQVLCSYITSS